MKELIHNLFIFIKNDDLIELGAQVYEMEGSDNEKLNFLMSRINFDYESSNRFKIPKKFFEDQSSKLPYKRFCSMQRVGNHLSLFEEIFEFYNSPENPLVAITPIVNGSPKFDVTTNALPIQGDNIPKEMKQIGIEIEDYLVKYNTSHGFDLPRLLNDDYFLSIKLLFNNGYLVSCCKLLLSFIDTIAFLAYGDEKNNFKKWLDTYAELNSIGVTSDELWELRNSLLHMTNLDSRKVIKEDVKRLMFYVGTLPENIPIISEEAKYFNLKNLIDQIPIALEKWSEYLNSNPKNLTALIERYDLVVSDVRVTKIK